ncbi:C40 family peptidase [Alkalihalobacterium elongatum]|uniref:C40 family peptidase n=1 Tax=Alkalihalobacterium elongatum TaxID=2675466 RepID=UPI001C1F5692|nr:peptidoglycan-binding protein [Alkalihalobacterium elongatum]
MAFLQQATGKLLASSVILSSVMNLGVNEKTFSAEPNLIAQEKVSQNFPTLLFGQEDESVVQLQVFLSTFNYYTGKVDGLYGILTKQAVRNYQRSHSLKADGIAGKKTLNHLYHDNTDVYNTINYKNMSNSDTYIEGANDVTSVLLSAEPSKTLTKISELSSDLTLKMGDKGKAVILIQEKLSKLGYHEHIDGIYGPKTKLAITHYQKAHQLTADGIAGPETIKHINAEKEKKTYLAYKRTLQQSPTQPSESEPNVITLENNTIQVESTVSSNESTTNVDVDNETDTSHTELNEVEESKVATANSSVISTAKSLIGTPYKWGGTSRSGFDCSGYLQYVYKQHGKSIPRTTSAIWGASSSTSNPQPGDLVFFTTYKSGPSHVGIYLGSQQFVHASSSSGVTISSIDGSYWDSRYLGARTLN